MEWVSQADRVEPVEVESHFLLSGEEVEEGHVARAGRTTSGFEEPEKEQSPPWMNSVVHAWTLKSWLWFPSCETRPVRIVLPWRPWCRGLYYFGLHQRHPDHSFLWCLILENLDSTYFWQWSPTVPCCSLACEHLSDPGRVDHIRLYVILNCVYFVQHQERTNKKNTDTTSTVCTCWSSALQQRRFRKSSVFVNLLSYTCLNRVLTGSCDVWCIRTNLYL